MKKVMAMVLALVLVVAFSGMAFAAKTVEPCPEPDCCAKIHRGDMKHDMGKMEETKLPQAWGPEPIGNDSHDGF